MAKFHLPRSGEVNLVFSSLLVAFLIWLIAKQNETERVTLSVKIKVVNLDPLCELTYAPPETGVHLQYPTGLRSFVTKDAFAVEIDASKARTFAGVRKQNLLHPISIDDLVPAASLPASVKAQIIPLAIIGDRVVTLSAQFRSLPVAVDVATTGSPKAGYVLARKVAAVEEELANLRLVAMQGELDRLRGGGDAVTLETEPLNLSDPALGARAYVRLIVPEGCHLADAQDSGRLLEPEDWRVLVNVPIVEETIERVIDDVPITIRPYSDTVRLDYSPQMASVKARGPRSLVNALKPSSFTVTYLAALNETPGFTGNVALTVRFDERVPETTQAKVTILSFVPETVQLTVTSTEGPEIIGLAPPPDALTIAAPTTDTAGPATPAVW